MPLRTQIFTFAASEVAKVVLALGVDGVSFWQAEAVNSFGLAFYVVLGSLKRLRWAS